MTARQPDQTPVFPASSAQRQLWFLEQIYPGQPLNNLNVELRPAAPLRPEPLRAALSGLVDRHEALRTTFHQRDGALVQAVTPRAGEVDLAVSDLRDLTAEQARERLAGLRQGDAAALFDLATGPVLRTRLVYLPGDAQAVILVVHHIVADATSVGVMVEDLAALYAGAAEGTDPGLPPLRIQYLDYAAWQQKRQDRPKAAESVRWWRQQLADLPTIRLVPGQPRPTGPLDSGGWYAETWDPDFVHDLRGIARAHATTVFAVLLAGYSVLLHRYTGGTDLPIGTPVLGRPTAELRRVVGLFVNMLVLRVDVSGDPGFGELLTRARRTVHDALAHEDTPFERIVSAVAPTRSLGVTALFQVGINMVPAPPPAQAGRVAFLSAGTEFGNGTAKYDLFLTFNERADGGLEVVVEWRRGVLADATARALPAQLHRILRGALADPQLPVGSLPLLEPDEAGTLVDYLGHLANDARDGARPTTDRGMAEEERAEHPAVATTVEAPTVVEELLAGVFAEVLGHPSVDTTTGFFALGGDSVASLRVVGLAAQAGLEISPSDVFLHQSVAELARVAKVSAARASDQLPQSDGAPHTSTPDPDSSTPPADPAVSGPETLASVPEPVEPTAAVEGYRASDFPDAGLSQNQLNRLVARLAAASGRQPGADDQRS